MVECVSSFFRIAGLIVWNPATHQWRKLPLLLEEVPRGYWSPSHTVVGLGFGYGSWSDDYKVLQIIRIWTFVDDDSDAIIQFEIWILGLRSGSGYWRKTEGFPFDEDISCSLRECHGLAGYVRSCFVDGAFHFVCHSDVIIAFDLAKETFSQNGTRGNVYDLQVFEGCLCICYKDDDNGRVDPKVVYISKKDGGEFSWTKSLSTTNENFHSIHGILLDYSKEGDRIFIFDRQDVILYSFGIKEESLQRIIEIGDLGRIGMDNADAFFCFESLVSPYYGANEESYPDQV